MNRKVLILLLFTVAVAGCQPGLDTNPLTDITSNETDNQSLSNLTVEEQNYLDELPDSLKKVVEDEKVGETKNFFEKTLENAFGDNIWLVFIILIVLMIANKTFEPLFWLIIIALIIVTAGSI